MRPVCHTRSALLGVLFIRGASHPCTGRLRPSLPSETRLEKTAGCPSSRSTPGHGGRLHLTGRLPSPPCNLSGMHRSFADENEFFNWDGQVANLALMDTALSTEDIY